LIRRTAGALAHDLLRPVDRSVDAWDRRSCHLAGMQAKVPRNTMSILIPASGRPQGEGAVNLNEFCRPDGSIDHGLCRRGAARLRAEAARGYAKPLMIILFVVRAVMGLAVTASAPAQTVGCGRCGDVVAVPATAAIDMPVPPLPTPKAGRPG
jgi:hypothetical protein